MLYTIYYTRYTIYILYTTYYIVRTTCCIQCILHITYYMLYDIFYIYIICYILYNIPLYSVDRRGRAAPAKMQGPSLNPNVLTSLRKTKSKCAKTDPRRPTLDNTRTNKTQTQLLQYF